MELLAANDANTTLWVQRSNGGTDTRQKQCKGKQREH